MAEAAPLLGFAILCLAALVGFALAVRSPSDAQKVRNALAPAIAPADLDYVLETQKVTLADSATLSVLADRLHQIGALSHDATMLSQALWVETAVRRSELKAARQQTLLAMAIAIAGVLLALGSLL